MAETSGFFDAEEVSPGVYDRTYLANQFAHYFAMFIGNGVFANPLNQLQVFAGDGSDMVVGMREGNAFIDGYWYKNDDFKYFTLDFASGTQDRIDAVVIGWDRLTRKTTSYIKTGTPSSGVPVAPTREVSPDLIELYVGLVYVSAGVTGITNSNITDARPDNTYCGFVTGVIDQLDTTTLFQQFESVWNQWFSDNTTDFTGTFEEWFSVKQQELSDWFEGYVDRLGEGEATGLQLQIDGTVNVNVRQDLEILGFVNSNTSIQGNLIVQELADGRVAHTTINRTSDELTTITEALYDVDRSTVLKTKITTINKADGVTNITEEVS